MARMILKDEKLTKQTIMFSEEVEANTRGARASQHKHTPMFALRLDSNKNNEALNEKKRMRPPGEGHHLN
jgi:putative aminopeptidase FrvX